MYLLSVFYNLVPISVRVSYLKKQDFELIGNIKVAIDWSMSNNTNLSWFLFPITNKVRGGTGLKIFQLVVRFFIYKIATFSCTKFNLILLLGFV